MDMQGEVLTEEAKPVLFSEWAKEYLNLEEVKRLKSHQRRAHSIDRLVEFLGRKLLNEIRVSDVEAFRAPSESMNGPGSRRASRRSIMTT